MNNSENVIKVYFCDYFVAIENANRSRLNFDFFQFFFHRVRETALRNKVGEYFENKYCFMLTWANSTQQRALKQIQPDFYLNGFLRLTVVPSFMEIRSKQTQ